MVSGLDEGSAPRQHHEYVDHEGLVDEGARWLWEAVAVNNETVAIKQIELSSSEAAHCGWRRHADDDAGGLAGQALDLAEPGLTPVPALRSMRSGTAVSTNEALAESSRVGPRRLVGLRSMSE